MSAMRIIIVLGVSLWPLANANGQGSVAVQSAPAPVRLSGLAPSVSTHSYVPPQAGGYQLANTSPAGNGSNAAPYVFKQSQNSMTVVVEPYASPTPSSLSDTMTLLQASVEPIRTAYELASQRAALQAYHKLVDRAEEIRIDGRTIHSYRYFAEVQGVGQDGKYVYFAAYALPSGVVQVRGTLPWDPPPPANGASPSMMPVVPVGQPGGVQNAMDGGMPDGGVGGLEAQGGGGAGLGTQASAGDFQFGPPVADPAAASYQTRFTTFGNDLIGGMVNHADAAPAHAAAPSVAAGRAKPIPAACAKLPVATDSVTYRVYATLNAPRSGDSFPPGYLSQVLDAVRQAYVVPNPLRPRAVGPMVSGGRAVMAPAVFGEVGFTLNSQGRLSDAGLTQSSLSPGMDLALYNSLRRADSLLLFPGQVGFAHPGPVRFFLDLSSYQPKGGQSTPLFAVRLAAWHPGSPPAMDVYVKPTIPAGAPTPTAGDSAVIQFVVDGHGVPIKNTVRLVAGTNLEIAEAVIHGALYSRYDPAMAAGCPVYGLLQASWRMGSAASP